MVIPMSVWTVQGNVNAKNGTTHHNPRGVLGNNVEAFASYTDAQLRSSKPNVQRKATAVQSAVNRSQRRPEMTTAIPQERTVAYSAMHATQV